jgi:hypothetical protein
MPGIEHEAVTVTIVEQQPGVTCYSRDYTGAESAAK